VSAQPDRLRVVVVIVEGLWGERGFQRCPKLLRTTHVTLLTRGIEYSNDDASEYFDTHHNFFVYGANG